jgi:hypothetical protein
MLQALAKAPIRGGAFGGVGGGGACECASRGADSHGADAQGGGGSMEAGRMITRLMTSESSSKRSRS